MRASTRNLNRRFHDTSESPLGDGERIRRGRVKRGRRGRYGGNNLPEIRLVAFGDWIHSYLSPRQSVDSERSTPSPSLPLGLPPPFQQPLQPRSPPTPFFSFPTSFSRSAKPRSLTGILNTVDSSVFFRDLSLSFSSFCFHFFFFFIFLLSFFLLCILSLVPLSQLFFLSFFRHRPFPSTRDTFLRTTTNRRHRGHSCTSHHDNAVTFKLCAALLLLLLLLYDTRKLWSVLAVDVFGEGEPTRR